ncbi:hypothetical protein [Devosia epidermidihirudinis]|nr:hypothetical protein [Devosia epidermidihirudinis]
MKTTRNLFRLTLDALVEGRARQAKRFLEQYERDHPSLDYKFKGR